MLKICIVIPHFFPVPAVKGGAVEQLATFLADENEKKHMLDLTFISIKDAEAVKESYNYKNSKFYYISINQKKEEFNYAETDDTFMKYMKKVSDYLENNTFDYIIMMGGKKEHVIPSIPYEKRITYLHGYEIEKGLHKYYKKIIVVSDYIAKRYNEETDTPKNDVISLNNAIHIEYFDKKISQEEKEALRNKYNISKNDIVISFCGRTIKEKGIEELIKAFKTIDNIKQCKLLVVGNCNYAKQVKTAFEEKLISLAQDMKDKIVFTGFIPNKELYKIHNISNIAVIPSVFDEPFGLTVIEAMASGLPLIVSDAGAIPDIVDSNNAIIVKRGEDFITGLTSAMNKLIGNNSLCKKMAQHSSEMSKKYDTPQYFNNFVEILENIL